MHREIKRDTLYYMMHTEIRDGSAFSHHASRGYGFVMFLFCMVCIISAIGNDDKHKSQSNIMNTTYTKAYSSASPQKMNSPIKQNLHV